MTVQIADILLFEEEEAPLEEILLDPYFLEHPDRIPRNHGYYATDLWRGYVALLEIVNSELVVKDIFVLSYNMNGRKIRISELEYSFSDPEDRKISWYSGLITLYFGLVKGGRTATEPHPSNIYKRYKVLEIKEGKLIESRQYTHPEFIEFKHKQLEYFSKTEEYSQTIDWVRKILGNSQP